MDYSVVLPTFNEESEITKNLEPLYTELREVLRGKKFEIIIADNGSTDNTAGAVSKISSVINDGIVYTYVGRRGRGGALAQGFGIARGQYIVVLSIDRAWNEDFLAKALLELEAGFKIVYGPKDHPRSQVSRPLSRRIGSLVIKIIIRAIFRVKLFDTQCIKVFHVASIPFLEQLGNYNYFAEADFALRAYLQGIPCTYVPVKVRDFRKSSKVNLGSFFEFLTEAVHFRKRVWRTEKDAKGKIT